MPFIRLRGDVIEVLYTVNPNRIAVSILPEDVQQGFRHSARINTQRIRSAIV